jgi:hypothetical protein
VIERPTIARAVARSVVWIALGAAAASCEPQDIYLFDPPPPVSAQVDAGVSPPIESGPSPGPDAAPPRLPEQPQCTSSACEACVADGLCGDRSPPSVCHPFTGLCALACEVDADRVGAGVCPTGERCNPTFEVCVACVEDTDCSGALPACDVKQGRCVECVGLDTCPALRPVCDSTQHCVECVGDVDCAAAGEVCLLDLARCVQCRDDSDCRARVGDDDDDGLCLPGELRCVECIDDGDCASDPEKPFCSTRFECEDERE